MKGLEIEIHKSYVLAMHNWDAFQVEKKYS